MENDFDVVIVGGGPAGCSTALQLARTGYRCLLVEKSIYSEARIGETLPPSIRRLLTGLGAWERFCAGEHRPALAIQAAWGRDQLTEQDTLFDPYGSGWHVDRMLFDRALAELAGAAGARVMQGATPTSIAMTNDRHWRLGIDCSGRTFVAHAIVLVDASGRRSTCARQLGAKRITTDRLVGCVGFFRRSNAQIVGTEAMLVESTASGWWYSTPLQDDRLVAAYMTDADLFSRFDGALASRFLARLSEAPHTAKRLESFRLERDPSVHTANTSRLDRVWGENWIAVGDSAMAFDPLSSQGVYTAMNSGLDAARAIAAFSSDQMPLAAYAAQLSAQFDRYMLQRHHYYSVETRWSAESFWLRRQRSAGP